MSFRRSCLLVALTYLRRFRLPMDVEGRSDRWYATICSTGRQQRVSIDENGLIFFGYGDSIQRSEDRVTDSMNDDNKKGKGDRWLLRSTRNRDGSHIASSAESASALPWTRQTEQEQQGDDGFYDLEAPCNMTILPTSLRNSSESQLLHFVRPCLCHPKQFFDNFYGPNETVPDLYLCPVSASYCGIPLPETGHVECFGISVQEVVAVKTWPVTLLWYLCFVLICCFSMHAINALNFGRSFCDPRRNSRHVDRILAAQTAPLQPPSYWNVWAANNYRFEQNLLVQTRMILRTQDIAQDQQCREQGLSAPLSYYHMKVKRYAKEDDRYATAGHGLDDTIHEQACMICFVPLGDGDIVGDLACQHIFHKDCLKSWFMRKNACPLCHTILATRRPDPQPHVPVGSSTTHNNNT